ncbi:hydroxypyruvate isomerase [Yersinia pseudotuberculosis]|uniref:hydroxypyruvate isomerase n=1 Tax=Yersinia pseudotuberculosis TaxID=633 RepID=UPI0038B697EB
MGTIQITSAPEHYKLDEEERNHPYLLIFFGCINCVNWADYEYQPLVAATQVLALGEPLPATATYMTGEPHLSVVDF